MQLLYKVLYIRRGFLKGTFYTAVFLVAYPSFVFVKHIKVVSGVMMRFSIVKICLAKGSQENRGFKAFTRENIFYIGWLTRKNELNSSGKSWEMLRNSEKKM